MSGRMKPILFSTPMVQAILAGKKTMTRRVIKFPEGLTGHSPGRDATNPNAAILWWAGGIKYSPRCVGDVLWVRETFTVMPIELPDGKWDWDNPEVFYAAEQKDADTINTTYVCDDDGFTTDKPYLWKPSIHMPFKHARIFLRVTDVRAERLQDITVQDARAEGFPSGICCDDGGLTTGRGEFQALWDDLNAARGYGWETNPWVWVYEFEPITRDEAERIIAGGGAE